MLLGIVLHAALPYMPDAEGFWPVDKSSSDVIAVIFAFIHIWRMPLFFILAGFFAHLIISNKSWRTWWGNRLLRIGIPIMVFSPLMSATLPWIFAYGYTNDFVFFYSDEGQPFHLWFLWHLLIFVSVTIMFRGFYLVAIRPINVLIAKHCGIINSIFHKTNSIISRMVLRTRFPLLLITLCTVINLPTHNELLLNPLATGLYFTVGYSLYKNPSLFSFLKGHWKYYFAVGILGFVFYLLLETKDSTDIANAKTNREYLTVFTTGCIRSLCAVLLSYACIGCTEKYCASHNATIRYISDATYWMYLIHLPIVTLITFLMFNISIPIGIKFTIAIGATFIVCLGTYRYLVRTTPLSNLLNGRGYPAKETGL